MKREEKNRDWDEFRTVYRTGDGAVVKKIYDPEAALSEALNMVMIRSVTSIPVPELRRVVVIRHARLHDQTTGVRCVNRLAKILQWWPLCS